MGFTGSPIFPGLQVVGVVSEAVRELAVTFNLQSLDALNQAADVNLRWVDQLAGVTPAVWEGRVPVDLTALDGFEPYDGERRFKQIEVIGLQAKVNPWQRNIEWDIRYDRAGNLMLQGAYNTGKYAAQMIDHARVMKARLAASVLMQGTTALGLAKVYAGNDIPGAGKALFATDHLANPLDANSRTFSNYFSAAGTLTATTMATVRQNMRKIPSPAMNAEVLGLQVTDIIGPTSMEEVFRAIALSEMVPYSTTVGNPASAVAAAGVSNIYHHSITPCNFWIAPQLDADPWLAAHSGAQLWFAVSRTLKGANAVEMVAPTAEFTPSLRLLGDGSEEATKTRKVRLYGDLDAGAAAGLPHVIARYESV